MDLSGLKTATYLESMDNNYEYRLNQSNSYAPGDGELDG